MQNNSPKRGKRRAINRAPYLLLLPSAIYLALFFAWPMARSLTLAFRTNDSLLKIHSTANVDSDIAGDFRQNEQVTIVSVTGLVVENPEPDIQTELWYQVRTTDTEGQPLAGWLFERTIREDDPANEGEAPTTGIIRRPRRTEEENPQVPVLAQPGTGAPVAGEAFAETPITILGSEQIEIWYQISGTDKNGNPLEGWAQGRYIDVITEGELARIDRGDTGEWTTRFIDRMVHDRAFDDSVITTFTLIIIIIPIQFVVALIMALVIQARLRGNSLFLYLFAIPLGVSDLATGIVWFSIFTQRGFINSFLQSAGFIGAPLTFISPDTRQYMMLAIVLAEVWRATSIVMVILISGLQAIPQETLEAAELFGADLWQRIRYVILPLLKPSLQVALILRTILAFQVFAVVIAIAGRGMTVLAYETFRWYDDFRNPNVAAAYAGFILLLSMITAVFYLRAVRTQEEQAR